MKHTEGPWQVGSAFDNYGEVEIAIEHMTPAGNLIVAVALGGLQGQDANARLIAEAPTLLAELKFAVSLLKPMFGKTVQVQRMESAIKRAEGDFNEN
jgi:hypothetical protein